MLSQRDTLWVDFQPSGKALISVFVQLIILIDHWETNIGKSVLGILLHNLGEFLNSLLGLS